MASERILTDPLMMPTATFKIISIVFERTESLAVLVFREVLMLSKPLVNHCKFRKKL